MTESTWDVLNTSYNRQSDILADALNRDVIKKNKMRSKLFVRKDLESVKLPEIFSTKRMHFK